MPILTTLKTVRLETSISTHTRSGSLNFPQDHPLPVRTVGVAFDSEIRLSMTREEENDCRFLQYQVPRNTQLRSNPVKPLLTVEGYLKGNILLAFLSSE